MDVLYIETFYGGSHKRFTDQWISHSCHSHQLKTLPPRFWKWRQAGSAIYLAETIQSNSKKRFDAMVISGMIDLAHLKTLRPDLPPAMLYIHENQFAYPLQSDEKRDFRYGMIDLVNILSAETVAFNSGFNRRIFFKECRNLFQRLPDAVPRDALKKAEEKSGIIYPGIDIISVQSHTAVSKSHKIPLIIWNHRHEYDKDPDTAFRVLENLHKKGIPFRLAILGERFSKVPEAISRARRVLSDHIEIDDYPPGDDYYKWLRLGDIVISTALQENFGLSVIEAASAGCWPLLPRRLAYPEVMPAWVAEACFWDTEKQLENKLEKLLITPLSQRTKLTRPLSRWLTRYSWTEQAEKLDSMIISTASGKKHPEKSW